MPIYEFECPKGTITEKFAKMGTTEIKCPRCHQTAKRITSAFTFILKGGGWYSDGYASKPTAKSTTTTKRVRSCFKTYLTQS